MAIRGVWAYEYEIRPPMKDRRMSSVRQQKDAGEKAARPVEGFTAAASEEDSGGGGRGQGVSCGSATPPSGCRRMHSRSQRCGGHSHDTGPICSTQVPEPSGSSADRQSGMDHACPRTTFLGLWPWERIGFILIAGSRLQGLVFCCRLKPLDALARPLTRNDLRRTQRFDAYPV